MPTIKATFGPMECCRSPSRGDGADSEIEVVGKLNGLLCGAMTPVGAVCGFATAMDGDDADLIFFAATDVACIAAASI
jgi:hypothetical protein